MELIKSLGYNVIFEEDRFKNLNAFLKKIKFSSVFILCDENTLQHCLPVLISNVPALASAEIIEVESGETSKDIQISSLIWQTLMENEADRNSLIINLGGGVITDLGGFSASLFKRGIRFLHVPTSLLAMCDASVGGKTAIDFHGVKNLIGNFTQPIAVYVNPVFLKTLPPRHLFNGLAEVYKIALVSDKKLWQLLKSNGDVAQIILSSIKLKNKIVLKDPYDKGIRQILNFGHSIGHALEAVYIASVDTLFHGEAILAGMCIEAHLAFQKKLLSKKEFREIIDVLNTKFELPVLSEVDMSVINKFLFYDKKTKNKIPQFALINKIGNCKTNITVTAAQLERAFSEYKIISDAGT